MNIHSRIAPRVIKNALGPKDVTPLHPLTNVSH